MVHSYLLNIVPEFNYQAVNKALLSTDTDTEQQFNWEIITVCLGNFCLLPGPRQILGTM